MVYAQPRICPREWDAQTPQGFWNTSGSPILGQTNRPCNCRPKKRIGQIADFTVSADRGAKLKEIENLDKYLKSLRKLRKLWSMKLMVIPIVNGALVQSSKELEDFGTGTVGLGNKRTIGDHLNYSIVDIGQNTEESSGDLRILAVNQTLVRNHRLMLVWKTVI